MRHTSPKFLLFILPFFIFSSSSYAMTVAEAAGELINRLGGRISTNANLLTFQNTLEYFKQKEDKLLTLQTTFAYGFTQTLGAQLFIPTLLENIQSGSSSKGIGDIIPSLQWTFFQDGPNTGLALFGIKFPTGDRKTMPMVGTGTFDLAIEFNVLHNSKNWYFAFDLDMILTTKRKGFKPGNDFEFEYTFGRIFHLKNSQFYFNLDLAGFYQDQDRFRGVRDPDSGGHVIFVGPLLSWSSNTVLVEFLFQWPFSQHLFGNQPNFNYTTFGSLTITF